MVAFVHEHFEEQLLTFYIGIIAFRDTHILLTHCKFYNNIGDNKNDKNYNNEKPRKLSKEIQNF